MPTRRRTSGRQRRHQAAQIQQPSVRTYRTWTPALLRNAEFSADSGYIRHAVDVCDWLLGDDKVRGALDGRINALFGADISFEASGDRRRRNRAARALEVGEDWWTMFPSAAARQVGYWAILLGLGPGTLRYEQLEEHDGRDLPILHFFHPQPLRYDWARRTWIRRITTASGDAGGAEEPIEFGDGVWLGHMPFGDYRPWSLGLWRSLAPWVLLKAYARSDYGVLGEAARKQVVEIDKEVDDTREKRKELADALKEMGADGAIVLPPGYSYKLVEASAATKDLYDKQIKLADNAIAITIRGGNLTTNVEQGSRAAAEVQERTGDQANLGADAEAWSTTAHDQVLVYWAEDNFADARLAPWPVYATEPEEDRKQKAEVMVQALAGAEKAELLGFEVDRKAFIDEFQLGFLKPGEKREQQQPPPPPPEQEDEGTADAETEAGAKALAAPRKTKGQKNGQDYVDRVERRASGHGAKHLSATVAGMIAAVRSADDFEAARRAIVEKYGRLAAPSELASLTEAAITMSQLGGHLAVREDVPELDDDGE